MANLTQDDDLGFSFREKDGEYVIYHHNRTATRLRGEKAAAFRSDVEVLSDSELQQVMARLTGNYKRGNERTARNHPRNRRR